MVNSVDWLKVKCSPAPATRTCFNVGAAGRPVWKVTLDPTDAGGPYVITASSGDCQITLSDVLFGDVWFCSGQSNMVQWVNNVSLYECISSVCTDI